MNKIEKSKKAVIWIGVACFLLAIAGIVSGIWVMVSSIKQISDGVSVGGIFGIIAGVILCIMAFGLIWVGIYFTWVGSAVKATHGSIKDDDLCQGTVNMKKCAVCGSEVSAEDKICGNCGNTLVKTRKCKACGKEVERSKKYCTECGAPMTTPRKKKTEETEAK